ncbi:UVI-1 [Chaetomium strumarium]|uniref:UVI-1 n=1 Tax=Chaetomium strumarium TaxID=1170767 RepID=A0AAJ0GRS4_9PEZI|nr:UVI-1 [Chaetomium strumarium]
MVSLRSLVTGAALIAAPVMATLSPAELVDRINELTKKSEALHAPVQSITLTSAPLIALGQGPLPALLTGGADILSSATVLISNLDGIPQGASEDDLTKILDAFRDCVHVNQELLKVVVSKADLLKSIPVFGGPATVLLGPFEGFANAIAGLAINMSESWVEQFKVSHQDNCLNTTRTDGVSVKRAEVFVA